MCSRLENAELMLILKVLAFKNSVCPNKTKEQQQSIMKQAHGLHKKLDI